MDILGIDIGTTSVKYVRYRKKTDNIVSRGTYRYRKGLEELRDILSAIRDKEGVNVSVAIGISSVELVKKIFSVPVQREEEMAAEVDDIASRTMLVPLSDIHRRHIMLGKVEERGTTKQDILFLGAHKSFVDHVVAMFQKTGFEKLLLLTDGGFIYESMVDLALNGAVAVVDIGGRQTGIYVIDSGKLLLMREVMTACEAFKDAVVGGTALSPNEAEEHLWMNGFNAMSDDILALPFERLIAQIQRTFLVYSQKYPLRPVSRAWITGRGAKIPGLTEKLNQLQPEEFNILPTRAEVEQEYIPAYALATRGDKFPNLLPQRVTRGVHHSSITKYSTVAMIIIFGTVAFLSIAGWARLYYLKTAADASATVLTQKRQQLLKYNQNRQPAAGFPQVLLREMRQKDTSFVLFIKYLSSSLPSQVYLSSIEFNGDEIERGEYSGATNTRTDHGQHKKVPPGVVHLRGYIDDTDGELEGILTQVMVGLEQSSLLSNVRISQKQMRSIPGRRVMEFVVYGEFRKHAT